tara:strand:- start:1587 stop:2711 length:1125 start_codon:yes stop_codon:yes gene_type:complete
MSIPLCSNVAITKITQSLVDSNSSVLNDIAGTAKSKLPVQYFQLTENISGNLTMNNDSAHKKIILDTNGRTLLNSAGSPLTNNSSTNLELKGSGNVQSTLKTSTLEQTDATHTGTTNFANSDSSTIVVSNVGTDTTVEKYVDASGNYSYNGSSIDSSGVTTVGGSTPNAANIFSGSYSGSSTQYGMNVTDGTTAFQFVGDTSTSTTTSPASGGYKLYVATIQPNTVSQLRMDEYSNYSGSIGIYSSLVGGSVSGHNRYSGTTNHRLNFSGTRRLWFRYVRSGNDRSFVFTNNLNIACVLSGADPFDNVTVNSGATASSTSTNSTDGTYNITMTISGNDGNSHPYALAKLNNGTGTVDLTTQGYTGTRSSDGAID